MASKRNSPIYVVDTNILIDYPDIIPGDEVQYHPESLTIDLSEAHLVIPIPVIMELSSFKKERSDRGKAARTRLKTPAYSHGKYGSRIR